MDCSVSSLFWPWQERLLSKTLVGEADQRLAFSFA